jgi:hypothetical protein
VVRTAQYLWDRIVLTKYKLLEGVFRPNHNLHVLQVTGSVTSVPGSVLLRKVDDLPEQQSISSLK